MREHLLAATAAIAIATVAPPTHAVTQTRYQTAQGGVVCHLSNPGTNPTAYPRGSGFRNEGTTSAFVICGIPSANDNPAGGTIVGIAISLQDLSGVLHSPISCTATNGSPQFGIAYATKQGYADSSGAQTYFNASDFGGTSGQSLPNSDFWSITCNLPSQTAILYLDAQYTVDIGA